MMASIQLRDATPAQVAAVSCDRCGKPIQTRGWVNPERAEMIREQTGSYEHGSCLLERYA